MLQPSEVQQFHKNGFLLLKNIFKNTEIESFRRAALEAREKDKARGILKTLFSGRYSYGLGDLASKRGLERLLFDQRIAEVARSLIGPKLVYFGDSSYNIGEGGKNFHRDNVDRKDPQGPDWQGEYPIIRFGVYCQDHSRHSGGLKVRIGSHLSSDFLEGKNTAAAGKGKKYNIPSEVGDLLVWSIKIAHSGNAVLLRFWPGLCLDPRVESKIPYFLRVPEAAERVSLFLTLAAPGAQLDRYSSYQVSRGDYHEHWKQCAWHPEMLEWAKASGVEVRKPIPEYGSLHKV